MQDEHLESDLDSKFVLKSNQTFDTKELPKNMEKQSLYPKSFKTNFLNLVNHKISFDFILGMFLAIFRKKIWDYNLFRINQDFVKEKDVYSTFDNTAPHIIIWSSGFKNSKAYFQRLFPMVILFVYLHKKIAY